LLTANSYTTFVYKPAVVNVPSPFLVPAMPGWDDCSLI